MTLRRDEPLGKMVIVMRGIAGSGKSTKAQEFKSTLGSAVLIVSADDYFMIDGQYQFDRSKLGLAHAFCQRIVQEALQKEPDNGIHTIIVDNTNTTRREVLVYARLAHQADAEFDMLYSDAPWAMDVEECTKRNQHGVLKESIQAMKDRFWKYGEHPSLHEIINGDPPLENPAS